jgi:glycosyltransferase involved in cell wall biosynthesis
MGFVLPIPLTIIEAMACGTPVVCSDASSSPVISDRENGFVFESRNVQSLANCIGLVLRERWLADACVGQASRCVKESYSERVIVNRIVGMYENELNR